jgi:hypothetical protein
MEISTPSENISLHLYASQNKNFNFGTLKTSILHARSIFFKGGHPKKNMEEKNVFHENPVEVRSFDGILERGSEFFAVVLIGSPLLASVGIPKH